MRGKALHIRLDDTDSEITPAYAGKSRERSFTREYTRDHPRVCGEKERVSRCACWTEGSPPRMRGKGTFLSVIIFYHRITPAYAGKSIWWAL